MGTLTPKIIGIKILNSFKFKKEKEAKKEVLELLKHKDPEPDVNVKNESGWQPLHYAASYGFMDLVEVLCDKGAEVNGRDLNSQTPLHKAASRGYPEVVVALVARDAIVDTLDWHGQTPLELAVKGRFVVVMEILFRLGADYKLHDYSWVQKEKLDRTELEMKELIKQQVAKYPGYKNKGISKSLHYIDPRNGDSEVELTELNLTVKASNYNQPYYLYCSKVQSEYSHLKRYLTEEQKPFSDMFECMYRSETSSKKKQEFIFVIKLNAQPAINEEIVFVSPHGKVGKIIDININNQETDDEKEEEDITNTEDNQDDDTLEEITYVTVAVQMEQKQMVGFALALREKEPEVFVISKEAVKIQPEAEPDAEIDIPENAFDDPGELCLKVTESKSVNEEREDGNLLATNVLDMSMSNKQQPKEGKGITLSLPVHTTGYASADEEMCVITTSEEYPENEDDWEVIPAKKVKGKHGSALSFTATHFSIFVGASLEKIKKDKEEVTSGAQRSLYGTKKIVIFTLMKLKNKLDASYAVIVECATRKKAKKRIKFWWDREKYLYKEESDEIEVSENQTFKVHFDGNVLFHGGTDVFTLAYESKRKENYQIYDFTVKDRNGEGYSKVNVEAEFEVEEKEEKPKLQPVVIKTGIFCTEVVQVPIETTKPEPKLEYKDVANLEMKFDIPKLPKPKVPHPTVASCLQSTEHMDMKDEAMMPVLKYVSLRRLSTILTLNDVEGMASKLGVSREIVEGIMYDDSIQDDFLKVFQILESWRGVRPGAYKVDMLVEALMHIGKEDLATIIKSSAENDTFPSYFN